MNLSLGLPDDLFIIWIWFCKKKVHWDPTLQGLQLRLLIQLLRLLVLLAPYSFRQFICEGRPFAHVLEIWPGQCVDKCVHQNLSITPCNESHSVCFYALFHPSSFEFRGRTVDFSWGKPSFRCFWPYLARTPVSLFAKVLRYCLWDWPCCKLKTKRRDVLRWIRSWRLNHRNWWGA